jgi:predicted ATPase
MSLQKFVLTGGARSGKTAILLALEQMGEGIIREVASDLIQLEQARGVAEPWKEVDFQRRIFDWQERREAEAEKFAINDRVFIDRGLIDGIAYCQLDGTYSMMMDPKKIMAYTRPYSGIFLIQNIQDLSDTRIRRETVEQALKVEKFQKVNYETCGYRPIEIPVDSVDARARKILEMANNYDKDLFIEPKINFK